MSLSNRKFPRREISRPIGILYRGKYEVGRVHEISEGGLLLSTSFDMSVGDRFVVTMRTFKGAWVSNRVEIKYVKGKTLGGEFVELPFESRRYVRNLVASLNEAMDRAA